MRILTGAAIALAMICGAGAAAAQTKAPTQAKAPTQTPQPEEHDFVVRDFRFASGETLPELKLHYTTLGQPKRDKSGRIVNAVMVLHGTGGTGQQFLRPQFRDVLFTPGGLLDPAKYYIILPDGIGHGKSSKPSDGLHARFPSYDYDDMVAAQHALLTKGLGVDKLRLLAGTSMGCMHAFVWAETYPTFSDALMPLACQPTQIAGRNRLWRKMAMDAIRQDPAWKGGDYTQQPTAGLRTAQDLLILAGSATIPLQAAAPTRDAADAYLDERFNAAIGGLDANDLLYQLNASRNYDPSAKLETITAPVTWVNSADDFINPPELGIAEREAGRIKNGRYVLIPAGPEGKGHGTHTWAVFWKDELAALLARSEPGADPAPVWDQAAGEREFLTANAGLPGVVSLPGLQYKVLRSGPADGARAQRGDDVTVRYLGRFLNGQVFNTSPGEGKETTTFPLQKLIPGWIASLQRMRPGDVWELYIPAHLAYGSTGKAYIPADSTLVFQVELVSTAPHVEEAAKK
ncbi:alpha/beta fold hydrolase [Caulobacter sp. 17J65-9]|uniref:alpha/beta fold hydrolase n=1 Tax=Caulobacter sp. 17J65-9 TaxID=2709382 RepID=UPI0013CC8BEF|nr:alpha/beta fold hydrolase [Caulobacter sp. 17J65-9]NEX91801.1 alpha/beta fold hydrolase [Caulobacter sp. 17J65-9]